jgi:hypothetical protein
MEETELLRSEEPLERVPKLTLYRGRPSNWSFGRGWRIKGELPLSSAPAAALLEAADGLGGFDQFNRRSPCAEVTFLLESFAQKP